MITIVMPAYNEEKFIAEAIDSVLMQKYKNFQLLVVDDGSTDSTGNIVSDIANKHASKITLFQPGKIGKNAAFNLAASHAKGDWIYFMGADDVLPSDALHKWNNHTKHINPTRKYALCGKMKVFSDNKKYDGLILPKNMSTYNWSGPLTLMSKGMLGEILPLPIHYPNEDTWWSLCIRFFADERIRIDEIVVYYRIHDGNAISRGSSFSIFNEKYHSRLLALDEFIECNLSRLRCESVEELRSEIDLERYRYNGETLKILTSVNCKPKDKIRAVFLSKEVLYRFKVMMDRYMLGH